jgi:hypothetical protein
MKKLVTAFVLFSLAVWAQNPPAQQQPSAQPGQPQAPATGTTQPQQPTGQQPQQPGQQQQQTKTITNPAEYNAYVAAIGTQDPNGKIAALEGFLQQYPNSVVKEEALEQLMAAYQQTGNTARTTDAANRLLQVNPNSIRALALMAFMARTNAEAGQNPQQNAQLALQHGRRGLQALETVTKPEGVSDADFQKLKDQTRIIFNGAAGFGALQVKDYASAQQFFRAAIEASPGQMQLRDVYPLAVSYLEANPPQSVEGLWWIAKAATLAEGTPGHQQIMRYGRSHYVKYHGSDEGWNELLTQAKASTAPPAGFNITPAPSPAEQAAKLVETTPLNQMSFAHFAFILPIGGDPAEKVWSGIEGKPIAFQGRVVQASRTRLMLAATQDAIDQNRADVELTMAGPIPTSLMPRPGQDIAVQGTPVSYDPQPFLMEMEQGALIKTGRGAAKPKPGARKGKTTTTRRRPQ